MTCIVLIPLYKSELMAEEQASIQQNLSLLGNRFPVRFLGPEGVDFSAVEERFPGIEILRVSDEWLGTRCGIAGYNRMMLSREFYSRFADYDYMLICQPDVWLFRDELHQWCERGYDYIGAPWPEKRLYSLGLIRFYLSLRRMFSPRKKVLRSDLFNRVGNGGLSLRRIAPFIEVCTRYAVEIEHFLQQQHPLYNEDTFWALVPEGWHYPSADEARLFSIDLKPELALMLNGGRLPFGCHGWFRPERRAFWEGQIATHSAEGCGGNKSEALTPKS